MNCVIFNLLSYSDSYSCYQIDTVDSTEPTQQNALHTIHFLPSAFAFLLGNSVIKGGAYHVKCTKCDELLPLIGGASALAE